MKIIFRNVLPCALVLLIICGAAYGQSKRSGPVDTGSMTSTLLKGTGKAATLGVGSAAKVGWENAKVAAGRVAKPVAKELILNGAPKAAVFVLKSSGLGAKYLLPWAVKLSLL